MKSKDIIIGKLNIIDEVEMYDTKEQQKIKVEIERNNHNIHYLVFSHSYSLTEVSDKSYYFQIPFGKFKSKFIDMKNIDKISTLIRIYFSLFGLDEFSIYYESNEKAKEHEDRMCEVGDIVIDIEGRLRYYKNGYGWPKEKISFRKIRKIIKNGIIQECISGK